MYVSCCLFLFPFDWRCSSTKNAGRPNTELFVSQITHLLLARHRQREPWTSAEKQGASQPPSPRLGLTSSSGSVKGVKWGR